MCLTVSLKEVGCGGVSSVLCRRCGRKLRKIESVQRGYGEVCWKNVKDRTKYAYDIGGLDKWLNRQIQTS